MIKYKLEFNLSKFLSIFLTLHGSFGSEDLVSWGGKVKKNIFFLQWLFMNMNYDSP